MSVGEQAAFSIGREPMATRKMAHRRPTFAGPVDAFPPGKFSVIRRINKGGVAMLMVQ
jgi:hypothetical protein